MPTDHAKLCRTVFRAGTCLALLGFVPIVGAADSRFDAFMGRVVGNQTTVGFGTGGTPLATSSAGLGTPATVGNMGLSQAGSGVSVDGKVKVPLGNTGKVAEVVAKTPVSRAAMLGGVARVLSGPAVGVALALAAPALTEWFTRGGVDYGRQQDEFPDRPFLLNSPDCGSGEVLAGKCVVYIGKWGSAPERVGTKAGVCASLAADGAQSVVGLYEDGCVLSRAGYYPLSNRPVPMGYQWMPASMDDIAPYMDPPSSSGGPQLTPLAVKQAVENGIDPFGGAAAKVELSGPDTVPGAKRTTSEQVKLQPGTTSEAASGTGSQTQPGTKTTTTTETHKLTYQGDKVSYTTVTTNITNITNNVTGDTTNITGPTTETDNDAPEQDDRSECEKSPDSLNCADLDEPDGEIPKATASVEYHDENPFGSGACPASKYTNVGGQSVKVWDWEQTCGYITGPVYWITVTLGAFAATMIVAGGTGARL